MLKLLHSTNNLNITTDKNSEHQSCAAGDTISSTPDNGALECGGSCSCS